MCVYILVHTHENLHVKERKPLRVGLFNCGHC